MGVGPAEVLASAKSGIQMVDVTTAPPASPVVARNWRRVRALSQKCAWPPWRWAILEAASNRSPSSVRLIGPSLPHPGALRETARRRFPAEPSLLPPPHLCPAQQTLDH